MSELLAKRVRHKRRQGSEDPRSTTNPERDTTSAGLLQDSWEMPITHLEVDTGALHYSDLRQQQRLGCVVVQVREWTMIR